VEHAVTGGAVPLGREQAGRAGPRYAAAQQEDVGFLAGLQDAQLGVDRRELGDQPARVRLRAALARGRLVPRGPAVPSGRPSVMSNVSTDGMAARCRLRLLKYGSSSSKRRLPRRA
jgi:hypothetical protein